MTKKGKSVTRKILVLARGTSRDGAPLAALIIQKRLSAAGKRSPFFGKTREAGAEAMNRLIAKMINSRVRSVAFIKSGWLNGIKTLAALVDKKGQPPMDAGARQYGQAKGGATPATSGRLLAQLVNRAFGNKSGKLSRGRALRFAEQGEQKAFDNEVASMNQYIKEHMAPDIEEFNRQQR